MKMLRLIWSILWDTLVGIVVIGVSVYTIIAVGRILIGG